MEKGILEILEKFPMLSTYQHNPIKAKEFDLKIKNNIFINEQKFDETISFTKETGNTALNNIFVFKFIINNLINVVELEVIERQEVVLKTPHSIIYKAVHCNIEYLFLIQDKITNDFYQLITQETLLQYNSPNINIAKSFVIDKDKIIGYIFNPPKGDFLLKKINSSKI